MTQCPFTVLYTVYSYILVCLVCVCVCYNSVVIYILIPSWGSLHTPYRNQFSHRRPPAATATSSECWVAQESYGGNSWCAHSRTRTDTRSEKFSDNAGNDETCPLVNVAPNSFKWNSLSTSGCTCHCQPTNKLCLLHCSPKILIPLNVYVYTCPWKCMLLCDTVCDHVLWEMFFSMMT